MRFLRLNTLCHSIILISGIGANSLVWAETNETINLPTITVEATRTGTGYLQTPASVFRVDAPQQPESSQVNLTEIVKGIPSLQINNRENYAQDLQLSMRGFGARSTFGVRGIRLYVDGIPATMPDGQGQTSNIDLSSLDHIEVLTGPFSSLYGNSSGGTILTTTKEGQGRDSIQVGYYSGGSHDKSRTGVILQGGAKTANEPSYVISSSYFDTDGYRDHSAADKVLNNAKLTWNLDDGSKINWVTNYVKINADDPQGLSKAEYLANPKQVQDNVYKYNVRKESEQTQTGVTWNKPLNDKNELYMMGYAGTRSVTQYQGIPYTTQKNTNHSGGVIDFDRNYYGADFRWTGKELLPNTTFSAGVALDKLYENRQGYLNVNNLDKPTAYGVKGALRRDERNNLWNIDPYLQASWQFLPNWRIDSGLRYSNVHFESKNRLKNLNSKQDYDELLPSVALSWMILPQVTTYVSYGKGFETPTFTESSYTLNLNSNSPEIIGQLNQSLKPSSSENYEMGLKTQNSYGAFTMAVFETDTKNDIVSYYSDAGRTVFHNADKTVRKGVELSWQNKIWQDLSMRASYTYLSAKFDSDIYDYKNSLIKKGNNIPGIANNQGYIGLGWQPDQGLQVGMDMQYMDKVFVNDANTEFAKSYTVTGAHLGYLWKSKDWTMNSFVRVDNLFDKNYVGSTIVNVATVPVNGVQVGRYYEPADGRNFSAGLSITKQF